MVVGTGTTGVVTDKDTITRVLIPAKDKSYGLSATINNTINICSSYFHVGGADNAGVRCFLL